MNANEYLRESTPDLYGFLESKTCRRQVTMIMEEYHKMKVNEITTEDYQRAGYRANGDNDGDNSDWWNNGIKWFKKQLLK